MTRQTNLLLCMGITLMAAQLSLAETKIEWREGPKLPMPLGGHVAALVGDEIMVVGGTNWTDEKKHWRDEVWGLDEKTSTWQAREKLPVKMALPASAAGKDGLFLLGGWEETKTRDEALRLSNGHFAELRALPQPRALAGGART